MRPFERGEGDLPEALSVQIEAEVSRLVHEQRARAEALLKAHLGALERLTERLVTQGSCDRAGVVEVIGGA